MDDDLGQPAVVGGDDAAARRGRLERGVGQRVGPRRGDHDDVGGAVDRLDVVAEADQPQPVAEPELGTELAQLAWQRLSGPGVAGDQADGADRAQRRLGQRARQHLLALPAGDAPEHRDDEGVAWQSERQRAATAGARSGATTASPSWTTRTCAHRRAGPGWPR